MSAARFPNSYGRTAVRPLPSQETERKGVGGYPQAPTKEGGALSGLSRQAGGLRFARDSMCKQLLESTAKHDLPARRSILPKARDLTAEQHREGMFRMDSGFRRRDVVIRLQSCIPYPAWFWIGLTPSGDTIEVWGRVVSTGDVPAGLQAEAPPHLVKRWQTSNWQARASPSRLIAATFTGSYPRGRRVGDINRGAVPPTPMCWTKD